MFNLSQKQGRWKDHLNNLSQLPLCVTTASRTRSIDVTHTVILENFKGKYFLFCLNCHKKAKKEFYDWTWKTKVIRFKR